MTGTSAFKDKTLMITGGTGSFGNTVLKHFMDTDLAEIRIFSRDEKKQDDMRHRLQEKSPELASKVRFFIGDVRNAQSVRDAMHGVDYIFHAAALKQVPSCEFFPMEAVRTNVIGTDNVLHAAIEEGVDRVVCLSTDKAAYPINAMGKSKAMMESIIYANARNPAPVLNFFEGCDRILCVSDPDARYYAHMNLRAMLSGLAVDDRSLNTLAESVMRYFKDGDAEHDLDVMEDGLPPEAILRHSQVLRERAALALMVGENVERAVSYTDEAIGLLEGSLQVMAALECRWQLARLTLYDKPEVAKMQLSIAEERLATLNKQPSLGYPYLEMSLCYALLGMRAECRGAYERAAGFETPMSHYAPGIRINITAAAFCARFYMLTEMLGNPEEVCPLLKTREGRAWLSRYPKVSSLSKTLLCGKFLGYGDVVPAMTRLFLDEAGKLYAETWLVVQEIGLAFDLDSRKPGEEYGLVVEIQRHPLVADDDALARVAVQHGYTVLGARLDLCNEDLLGVDDAAAVFDVLDALGILAEGRVPTLEDIMKSYLESCVDVPAGGWGTFAER
ncbi:MAG: polysaccharide biosynthesis protein [Collinsella sp.]